MNFAISYSGGKDSALALYRILQQGHTPAAMITTVNIGQQRSWFHGIQSELLLAVSESLQIPLIVCECTPNNYAEEFERSLKQARLMGADTCVFGDIDIAGHKAWNEERCRQAGLQCTLPLWHEDRETLTREVINLGFKTLIKIIDTDKLDSAFLGQTLTIPLIERMKLAGVDVSGENGEFHTFVYDGPIFTSPIPFSLGEVIDFGTHSAIDLHMD
ncbi:MAG: diphthine--ammonia ligase [Defluviitaleaceae bacterium]|nr:diphthine--ammonia ligase [Defluviitaleaceae bacterium]